MNEPPEITAEDLVAFVDGELDHDRHALFKNLIENDNALASRVEAFRADKGRVLSVYGPLIERPLPTKWIQRLEEPAWKRKRYLIAGATAIATSMALVFGMVFTRQTSLPREDTIVAEALSANTDNAVPLASIDVRDQRQAVASELAISLALEMKLKLPDLSKLGYQLAAIHIYAGVPGGKAVELVYRKQGDYPLTLYVRHASGSPRFDQFEQRGLRVCVWQDDVVGMVMVGTISAAKMQRLASLAYNGLTP